MTKLERKTYVLYHAGCQDGFAAAWAAYLVLGADANYLPVAYGISPPDMEDGSDLFILDFSYPLAVLVALRDRMHLVAVIDHHASVRADLEQFGAVPDSRVRVVFETSRSGAALTWREFLPDDEPLPELLRHVEDRDLWRWQVPDSRLVTAGLATYPFDFAVWTELAKDIPRLKSEGVVALRMTQTEAARTAAQAVMQSVGGYTVPVVNATSFYAEVGDQLLALHPRAQFVALYRDTRHGLRRWSLRSRPDFDCSQVAKHFGGGGHPQACGFEEKLSAGAVRIARERGRHFKADGWAAEHDDLHNDGSLALAAACYAETAAEQVQQQLAQLPAGHGHPDWPWHADDWKPNNDPRRNLEKAGALIAAEIDRLERARAEKGGAE